MTDWDSSLYLRFEDERTRPSADLLDRVPTRAPSLCVDLGCGPGNSTELLAKRYPGAELVGVDTSPDMLAAARKRLPGATFVAGDVVTWEPARAPDVVFANAVLQWVPGHAAVFARLMGMVAPGGSLAVQMPDNLDEPSHALMRETAALPRFAGTLDAASRRRDRLATISDYYAWLSKGGATVDIWRTSYVHVLAGPEAIVEWVRATGLRPFLDALDEAEGRAFLAAYLERITRTYPRQADGRVLLPFPRLFMVATRP